MELVQASLVALWFVVAVSIAMQITVLRQARHLAPDNNGIPPGLKVPTTEIYTLQNQKRELYELLIGGKHLMLCFVHSSCKFCREIAPELDRVSKLYEGFHPVLISFDDPDSIRSFVKETGISLPIFRTEPKYVTKSLNLKRFPFGMLIDGEGTIMRREALKKENLLSWLIDIPQYIESIEGQERGVS